MRPSRCPSVRRRPGRIRGCASIGCATPAGAVRQSCCDGPQTQRHLEHRRVSGGRSGGAADARGPYAPCAGYQIHRGRSGRNSVALRSCPPAPLQVIICPRWRKGRVGTNACASGLDWGVMQTDMAPLRVAADWPGSRASCPVPGTHPAACCRMLGRRQSWRLASGAERRPLLPLWLRHCSWRVTPTAEVLAASGAL